VWWTRWHHKSIDRPQQTSISKSQQQQNCYDGNNNLRFNCLLVSIISCSSTRSVKKQKPSPKCRYIDQQHSSITALNVHKRVTELSLASTSRCSVNLSKYLVKSNTIKTHKIDLRLLLICWQLTPHIYEPVSVTFTVGWPVHGHRSRAKLTYQDKKYRDGYLSTTENSTQGVLTTGLHGVVSCLSSVLDCHVSKHIFTQTWNVPNETRERTPTK